MALWDPGIGGMSNRAVQGISIARRHVIAWVAALPMTALARPAERKQRIGVEWKIAAKVRQSGESQIQRLMG